ncbi:MAG: GNAT family protein [Pseudomonadota bacterium]
MPPATFERPGPLQGPNFRIEPFVEGHRAELRLAAEMDQSIWTYFPMTFNGAGARFDAWFDHALARMAAAEHFPYAVRRLSDLQIVGTTRFYDMAPVHRRLAIGSTWYIPSVRGTRANAEVRLLTLGHAFERLLVLRVELITDPENLASQAAMRILGAIREGVIRNHLIYHDGRVRDSILYSITEAEWPGVRTRLLKVLEVDEDVFRGADD